MNSRSAGNGRFPHKSRSSLMNISACAAACALMIMGCARTGPPPGGPVDQSGPLIRAVSPLDGAVNVPLKTGLIFEVDEWIESQSFKDAFFISPEPSGRTKFKIGLRRIKVRFTEGLEKDRTYIVTIGSGLRDLKRNTMAKSFTIAFSAGAEFDYGLVQGRVLGGKAGLLAALYSLNGGFVPAEIKGDFLTQTGADGRFSFPFIPPGRYRLAVFTDTDKNRLFDPETDALGLAPYDISVNEDTTTGICVKTVKRKHYPAKIRSAESSHRERIDLKLDRPLEYLPKLNEITIIDTVSIESVHLLNLWRHPADSARLVLAVSPLDSIQYRITIAGGVDFWGMQMLDSLDFRGTAQIDTAPPFLIQRSAKGDTAGGRLEIVTSEPIIRSELSQSVSLTDTTVKIYTLTFDSLSYCKYSAFSTAFNAGDSLIFRQRFLLDKAGNRGADSTFIIVVEPLPAPIDSGELGAVSGISASLDTASAVIVLFQSGKEVLRRRVEAPGQFILKAVPAGNYTVEAFIDRNRNGRFDYGLLEPFRFPEKCVALEDTFRVRAKWETGGIILRFD